MILNGLKEGAEGWGDMGTLRLIKGTECYWNIIVVGMSIAVVLFEWEII